MLHMRSKFLTIKDILVLNLIGFQVDLYDKNNLY